MLNILIKIEQFCFFPWKDIGLSANVYLNKMVDCKLRDEKTHFKKNSTGLILIQRSVRVHIVRKVILLRLKSERLGLKYHL